MESNKKQTRIKLTDEQQLAVNDVVSSTSPVTIITGGPGVGKTTIIKAIIQNLIKNKILFRLTSFTGRAVSRCREQTRCSKANSSTLHRLIAKCDLYNFDHLIIDEASMVTTSLFASIIKHRTTVNRDAKTPFKVTLIGDIDQLPPIDWGNFFKTMIKIGESVPRCNINVFRLTKSFRVAPERECLLNAFSIIRMGGDATKLCDEHGTFKIIDRVINPYVEVERVVKRLLDTGEVMDAKQVGIFAAYNADVDVLNVMLRELFLNYGVSEPVAKNGSSSGQVKSPHPEKENKERTECKERKDYQVGDRVIMTKNVYFAEESNETQSSKNLILHGKLNSKDARTASQKEEDEEGGGFAYMNGDTGTIKSVNPTSVMVEFDNEPGVETAFKISIPTFAEVSDAKKERPDQVFSKLSSDGEDTLNDEEFDCILNGSDRSAVPMCKEMLNVGLLKSAFSVTIHKAQGAEYDHVVVVVPRVTGGGCGNGGGNGGGGNFLNRNLFYTAVTRAKKTVTVITRGTLDDVQTIIRTEPPVRLGNLCNLMLQRTKLKDKAFPDE